MEAEPTRIRIHEVEGWEFPAGRRTRVFAGLAGLPARNFVMGHSQIYPGGGIPRHAHENEEVYVILKGIARMSVGDRSFEVTEGTAVYLPPNVPHELTNPGQEDVILMFVYSPATLVAHWEEERREGGGRG
ncbi:MAG: dimethylsulfonioproprionate lyase family protein [Armatimonadota bacterium]|nr:dimethylsulfonioproprionate lyase family protein [Armatimonadota bacterium]MDW8155634.1 dimethylsulfonioproprionate lyase family protein [Armatimonadota bacterium]